MGSFTSKDIVDEMIARNGDADPEDGERFDVVRIVEYTSPEGETTWGAVYRCEADMGMLYRYDHETGVIRNPHLLFERKE
jgi:hypothetical protein